MYNTVINSRNSHHISSNTKVDSLTQSNFEFKYSLN